MTRKERITGAIWGALVGDALSLGVHWIYDAPKIRELVGTIESYRDPVGQAARWHPHRRAGQFTHYGDQTLCLLESVASLGRFDLDDFARRWETLFDGYDGYFDGATKTTLKTWGGTRRPRMGGSNSSDLAGVGRMPPLLAVFAADDEEGFLDAVEAQTRMTHGAPELLEAGRFFGRLLWAVTRGKTVSEALGSVLAADYMHLPAQAWFNRAMEFPAGDPAGVVVDALGATCHTGDAFPSTLYLLRREEASLAGALRTNAMAGGDSAARGLLLGAILGAAQGVEAIPDRWREELAARDSLRSALWTLDLPEGAPLSRLET